MDPGLRVTSKECLSFKSNKKVFISSKKDAAGRSGGKAGLPPNMKFNKQKGYNDPAEMFPGKSEKIFKGLFCIWKYICNEFSVHSVLIKVHLYVFLE